MAPSGRPTASLALRRNELQALTAALRFDYHRLEQIHALTSAAGVVFPTSSHTRFQHSLGALFLAEAFYRRLSAQMTFVLGAGASSISTSNLFHHDVLTDPLPSFALAPDLFERVPQPLRFAYTSPLLFLPFKVPAAFALAGIPEAVAVVARALPLVAAIAGRKALIRPARHRRRRPSVGATLRLLRLRCRRRRTLLPVIRAPRFTSSPTDDDSSPSHFFGSASPFVSFAKCAGFRTKHVKNTVGANRTSLCVDRSGFWGRYYAARYGSRVTASREEGIKRMA
jgi:hypothetical protein